jgi:uncharacterized protein (UPF0548 family)
MGLRLHRPDEADLATLLAKCRRDSLTYTPVGGSLSAVAPDGMRHHSWTSTLPDGSFGLGVEALQSWSVHRGAGLEIATDGAIAAGTNVALSAPLPLGYVDACCRIVAVIEERDRYGFAYGTLPTHPESGEESFLVVRDGDHVRFEVQAVSKPRHPLARLVPPVADRLQDLAVRKYLSAMQRLTGESPAL